MRNSILSTLALVTTLVACTPEAPMETSEPVQTESNGFALVTASNPWGTGVAVDAYIGQGGWDGWRISVLWQRKDNGACNGTRLDNDSFLSQSAAVNLSNLADTAYVVKPGQTLSVNCSGTAHQVKANQFEAIPNLSVQVNGLDGNDFMTCNSDAVGWCYLTGGNGGDYLQTLTNYGQVWAGAGNDKLLAPFVGDRFGVAFYGQEGNDCLDSVNPITMIAYTGEGGTDSSTNLATPTFPANENLVSFCP